MNRKILGKISLGILSFFMMATPVLATEDNEAVVTYTHQVYEELGNEESLLRIREGETVTILEKVDTYYKVELEDGYIVYVEQEYIDADEEEVEKIEEDLEVEEVQQVAKEPVIEEVSKGEELVSFAKQYIGTPYSYGGTSLTNGVDCSGFVSQVYKSFDKNLQRSSRDQYATNGTKVTKQELQAGDLVFYGYGGSVSHVGIYAGNNMVVHASTTRGVVTDPLDLRGMPPIIGYKRVL